MARILVVDDDEVVRRAVRQALEIQGHDVDDTAQASQAIARFRERPADVVITDIVMPYMEGIETIMEVRALDSGVRILAVSGATQDGYLRSAVVLGADRSLEKPFSVRQLVAAVDDLLAEPPHAALDGAFGQS